MSEPDKRRVGSLWGAAPRTRPGVRLPRVPGKEEFAKTRCGGLTIILWCFPWPGNAWPDILYVYKYGKRKKQEPDLLFPNKDSLMQLSFKVYDFKMLIWFFSMMWSTIALPVMLEHLDKDR